MRGVTAGAKGLLDCLPSLDDAEAVMAGAGVTLPLRLRFDALPPERQPHSAAPFASSWRGTSQDEAFVAEVVERWRGQGR